MIPYHRYRKTKPGDAEEVRDFFQRTRAWSYGKADPVAAFPCMFRFFVPRTSVMKSYSIKKTIEYFANLVLAHNNTLNATAQKTRRALIYRYVEA